MICLLSVALLVSAGDSATISARSVATVDYAAWSTADSIVGFRQRDPAEGAVPSERTVVKVLRDHDALYIAVRAWDRDASAIRATQLRRDADLSADDNVTILIDSFHDRRGGWLFQTNPNGARWDAQITEGDNVNQDWNGIWTVTTSRDSTGWTAVFRIPFRTLRFTAGATAAFGFNVRRFIRRRNEEDLWCGWRRTQGLYQLDGEGELTGLDGVSRTRDIEILPYVLADAFQAPHDSVGDRIGGAGVAGKVGVDAKLAVSGTMTADLTVNTDFAQVEVDSQVINLTRFPTFFPEKRTFFLESSGIFDFGNDQALLFYSRRIGLTDSGAVVPILAGARLTGKAGPWTVGVLDARTGGIDDANDAVVRIKRDVFDRSYIGAIVTARTGSSVHGSDVAAGVDADFPLKIGSQNIEPQFWFAGTQTPDTAGTRVAWRIGTDFPNDLFDNNISVARYDSGFAPTLGFVRRTDAYELDGHIDFMPRPGVLGIRQFDFEIPRWDIFLNHNGVGWQNAVIEWHPVGGTLDNGDQFFLQVQRLIDAPPDTFTVFRGVTIRAGNYWWTQLGAQYQTSLGRPISGFAFVSTGTFYNGHSTETDGGVTWRSGGHLILGGGVTRTAVSLPVGHFVAIQSTGRLEYAFTTVADFLGFAQYDNALNRTDFDLRFHWTPVIGDDIYLVWNSGYTTDPLSRFRFPDRRAIDRPLTATLTIKCVHRIAP
jgi:hypothetical protein